MTAATCSLAAGAKLALESDETLMAFVWPESVDFMSLAGSAPDVTWFPLSVAWGDETTKGAIMGFSEEVRDAGVDPAGIPSHLAQSSSFRPSLPRRRSAR